MRIRLNERSTTVFGGFSSVIVGAMLLLSIVRAQDGHSAQNANPKSQVQSKNEKTVPAEDKPLPTARELHNSLKALVGRLKSVRVVAAERFETRLLPDSDPTFGINWHDLFINGDHVQLRIDSQNMDRPEWWKPNQTSETPLTIETMDQYDGNIYLHRPDVEFNQAEVLNRPLNKPWPALSKPAK